MSTLAPVPGSREYRRLRWKARLARPIFATGLHRLLLRGRGVIVAFHRVDDRVRGNPVGCGLDEFRGYLDFFQRHFRVVPLGELLDRVEDGSPGGRLAITFDDGYVDNVRIAAPELRARGLPACFFVTAGFIGTRTQPWWDVEYGARAEWMTWDDVRQLRDKGFEIGAHTLTHADLGRLDGDAAARELGESREILRRELGESPTLFSFPYGAPHRMTPASRARVRDAGYRCCLSGYGGTVARGDDPYHLRRAPVTLWHISPAHLGFELLFRPPEGERE